MVAERAHLAVLPAQEGVSRPRRPQAAPKITSRRAGGVSRRSGTVASPTASSQRQAGGEQVARVRWTSHHDPDKATGTAANGSRTPPRGRSPTARYGRAFRARPDVTTDALRRVRPASRGGPGASATRCNRHADSRARTPRSSAGARPRAGWLSHTEIACRARPTTISRRLGRLRRRLAHPVVLGRRWETASKGKRLRDPARCPHQLAYVIFCKGGRGCR